jgi:hypothetical protein
MSALLLIKELIAELDAIEQNPAQDENHFKQIEDLQSDECTEYSNTPQEKYAGIESVTDNAGGGVNGPKHAADLRTDTQSLYHYLTQMEHDRGKH